MRYGSMGSALLGLLLALLVLPARAAGDGLLPVIVAAQGETCIADTDYMRRNHMDLLRHQRDETVHDGIRTQTESLQNCLACHARDAAGQPVAADDPGQFCESCHTYAAVSIDCFSCHSSKPTPGLAPVGGNASTMTAPHAVAGATQ